MHALRHSFASLLATDLELAPTTLAAIIGHADAGLHAARLCARRSRHGDGRRGRARPRGAGAASAAD